MMMSSNFRLTASLKRPFASAANATSERSVSQSEHRKRYGTLARLGLAIVPCTGAPPPSTNTGAPCVILLNDGNNGNNLS